MSEALRLRAAVESNGVLGGELPPGASAAELRELRAAFAPRHLPEELLDLLSVMNGSGQFEVTLANIMPLLSCEHVVAETEMRRETLGEDDWCPAWVVISSEQWGYAAMMSADEPFVSSPVLDLSDGNQETPVAGASLTALISASADAWERGWRDPGEIDPGWYRESMALRSEADQRFPGDGTFRSGDAISADPALWPPNWPGRAAQTRYRRRVELSDVPGGRCELSPVLVVARDGQMLSVTDGSGVERVYLPPAFDPGEQLTPGVHVTMQLTRSGPMGRWPTHAESLECRGVLRSTD
ncbi:hypothetical protein OEB99_14150 [Actinotalea sp. M2MS4P-6]|uniref:hypothetical protein n=1 Tax=Actinotalea sp. M2MS4P-6 TaxID=2983762 RepID=UPI0021E3B475|nr:hypothetical protein [Actinotalea sp. M2MS4P-6]MCV2395455.1 hypothetical protein [Actinotalea sp. M2MS4P-6]